MHYSYNRRMNSMLWYFLVCKNVAISFVTPLACRRGRHIQPYNKERINESIINSNSKVYMFKNDDELFADLDEGSEDLIKNRDLSGCLARELKMGEDFSLGSFGGSMGFEEVTDWEYYYEDEDEDDEDKRVVVQPSPLDSATPKRTRSSSGSVLRLFRGEMQGRVSSMLRSKGMDNRVLIKEFSGKKALELAKTELQTISTLQSNLCATASEAARNGAWLSSASATATSQKSSQHAFELIELLAKAPFLGILGQVNVTEMLSDQMTSDANTWYRALGTGPPVYNSIWIVYPYAGLASLSNYASKPPILRILQAPARKGFFGNPLPPNPLPPWDVRANYIINGIFKQSLQALANLHDQGVVHRSIGRSSIYLSTDLIDKNIPSSPYATSTTQLITKLADFGFSRQISELSSDPDFRATARAFQIEIVPSSSNVNYLTTTRFAIAEDIHALGYVFLGILLFTLSEPEVNEVTKATKNELPPTDEDTLQRLLNDIFSQDFQQFRSYILNEDGNIYKKLVALLDERDGWELLSTMCFARERACEKKNDLVILTANGLLSSPFFR